MVVVTRYFGGILLGGGGLVRAYSPLCLNSSSRRRARNHGGMSTSTLRCDYNRYTKAESYITECLGVVDGTDFDDAVNINFHITEENLPKLRQSIVGLNWRSRNN